MAYARAQCMPLSSCLLFASYICIRSFMVLLVAYWEKGSFCILLSVCFSSG